MSATRIDYADMTWNPVWGCTGSCPYCYARKMAKRFGIVVNGKRYKDFEPRWIERNFNRPFPRKSSRIFVNSMSDIADWDPIWLSRADMKMRRYPEHMFIMLTKRSEKLGWYMRAQNTMLGASVTDQESYIAESFQVADGLIDFLSIEPLLGPIDMKEMTCGQILHWIIVGSETGNRKDRVIPKLTWLVSIRDFARENEIPLFFKESLRRIWPGELPQEYPTWPRKS